MLISIATLHADNKSRKEMVNKKRNAKVQTAKHQTQSNRNYNYEKIDYSKYDLNYTVKTGDTLYRIASENGLTYQELAKYNNISNPDYIDVGQEIKIPTKNEEPVTIENDSASTNSENVQTNNDTIEYSIKHGDTLSKIAKEYGLTYQELAQYNGIENPNYIVTGQTIVIPSGIGNSMGGSEISSTSNSNIDVQTNVNDVETTTIDTNKSENNLVQMIPAEKPSTESVEVPDTSNNIDLQKPHTYINLAAVKEGTRVYNAYQKYSGELENATYVKIDENTFMTITPIKVQGSTCYLTHMVINNPSQIAGEPAHGSYASGLETADSAANRLGSSLLINGSHFSYEDGSEDLKGGNNVVIVNGEIMHDGTSGGMEICLDNTGRLFTPNAGTTAQQLKDMGVVYTFSSHDSLLLQNGEKYYYNQPANDSSYNSTVIGMVEPCEYYILTGPTSNAGARDYLADKGCTYAKSMDQGGSVSLIYGNEFVNTPTDENGARAVGDFLYFRDK